jgi:hypothetical protein
MQVLGSIYLTKLVLDDVLEASIKLVGQCCVIPRY